MNDEVFIFEDVQCAGEKAMVKHYGENEDEADINLLVMKSVARKLHLAGCLYVHPKSLPHSKAALKYHNFRVYMEKKHKHTHTGLWLAKS